MVSFRKSMLDRKWSGHVFCFFFEMYIWKWVVAVVRKTINELSVLIAARMIISEHKLWDVLDASVQRWGLSNFMHLAIAFSGVVESMVNIVWMEHSPIYCMRDFSWVPSSMLWYQKKIQTLHKYTDCKQILCLCSTNYCIYYFGNVLKIQRSSAILLLEFSCEFTPILSWCLQMFTLAPDKVPGPNFFTWGI